MIEPLLQAERLLVHGLVDQAEQLYRRTLEADPRNSIAAVGLARVALERGDDGAAYRQACTALELDPQNAAALRLEARLSEVLAARGEPVDRPAWLTTSERSISQPATPDASPSEPAMLARNPSMADHQRVSEARAAESAPAVPQPRARRRPRSRLRRMLGL